MITCPVCGVRVMAGNWDAHKRVCATSDTEAWAYHLFHTCYGAGDSGSVFEFRAQNPEHHKGWMRLARLWMKGQRADLGRDALLTAALDFVAKVESGRARSTDSYEKFKAAIKVAAKRKGGAS